VIYDAVPDSDRTQGGSTIQLIGNFSLQNIAGSTLECSFQTGGGVVRTNVLETPNDTVVKCPAAS
jgi:hypothetical protein